MNDLRAALNAAIEKHRRELPALLPTEIKVGTRAISAPTEARKQLLSDDEVRRLVAKAFDVNESGDFGRLVLLAATTGARHSQLAAITVGDVQPIRLRIMGPRIQEGSVGTSEGAHSVPLAPDVLDRLAPVLKERKQSEPLLLRWHYRNAGPWRRFGIQRAGFKWEKDRRGAWGPAYEIGNLWAATVERAGVSPDTIMYALRHTSIVRSLRSGLPIRLVAALHDTSTEMIELHYSAYIVDATEELTRRAILSLVGPSIEVPSPHHSI